MPCHEWQVIGMIKKKAKECRGLSPIIAPHTKERLHFCLCREEKEKRKNLAIIRARKKIPVILLLLLPIGAVVAEDLP